MPVTRRHFIHATAAAGVSASALAAQNEKKVSPNDRIRAAAIGVGGMGTGDTESALSVPGVDLVAVSDIYEGRLTRMKEKHGKTCSPRGTTGKCSPVPTSTP